MGAQKKHRPKVSGNPTERLLRKMLHRIAAKNDAQKRAIEAENAEIERLNNLHLGHPDHAERVAVIWDPIIAWIDKIDHEGTIEYTESGLPILHTPNHASEEKWFEATSAIIAISDCYELIANEDKITDESNGLRRIGMRIRDGKPLTDADIAIARKSIDWMIAITKTKTPLQIQGFTTAIAIRAQMQLNQETNQAIAA